MPDDPNQPQLPGMRAKRQGKPAWATRTPAVPFGQMPMGSEKIFQAAAPDAGAPATPRVMIGRLFGRTRGRLNTKAAADQLGVSQRTVQRWVHDRKTPSSEAGQRLQAAHRDWYSTAAGRKSALGRKNLARIQRARRIYFNGHLKISNDVRKRENMQIDINLAARQKLQEVIEHMAAGDDPSAHTALEELIGESDNWGGPVSIRIDDLRFE